MLEKFKRYIKRTWKNKAVALLLIILGIVATVIDNDCTVLVFISIVFVIPLWFEKHNRIE